MINPTDITRMIEDARDRVEQADENLWAEVDAAVNALAVHCPPELGREDLTTAVWRAIGRYGDRRTDLFAQFLREARDDVLTSDPEPTAQPEVQP